jgi:hypothetical protein
MSYSLFSALAAAVTVAGFAAVVWLARLAMEIPPRRRGHLAFGLLAAYGALLAFRPRAWTVIDLAVLAGAVGGVLLVEGGLQTAPAIAVFLSVAAIVDFVSMSFGLSRILVEHYQKGTSNLLLYLTLVMPIRGRALPIVGASDLLLGGSAAAALLRLKLPPTAVLGAVGGGLLAAAAWGLFWRAATPAMPFLAAAVWLLVWWQWHTQRSALR